jgi:hypothetical protein
MYGIDNQETHFSRGLGGGLEGLLAALKAKQGREFGEETKNRDMARELEFYKQMGLTPPAQEDPNMDAQALRDALLGKRPLTIEEQQALDQLGA